MLERIIKTLKDNKISVTPQRYALIETLINNRIHPTFKVLYKKIREKIRNTTKAALYNNIEVLEKQGIMFEFSIYGVKHYDIIVEDHDHFVCLRCGKITDIEPHEKKEKIIKAGEVIHKSTFYFGICNKCKNKREII